MLPRSTQFMVGSIGIFARLKNKMAKEGVAVLLNDVWYSDVVVWAVEYYGLVFKD